jgi:hypothetical protein
MAMDPMDVQNEDEVVVEELDVFWHGALPEGFKLDLFQYPLRYF